jgi:hypothetical protein
VEFEYGDTCTKQGKAYELVKGLNAEGIVLRRFLGSHRLQHGLIPKEISISVSANIEETPLIKLK